MYSRLIVLLSFIISSFIFVSGNAPPMFNQPEALIFPEDTAIGTILTTLSATDNDGPNPLHFTIPAAHATSALVELQNERGDSATGRMVDVVLKAELDRDYTGKSIVPLRFTVSDGGPEDVQANTITQEINLYINDVNDEDPVFQQNRYEKDIAEDASLNDPVTTVLALDPDSGPGGIVKYSMEPVGQAISDDYRNAFAIDETTGVVTVNTQLDANVYNYYEYTLIAKDGDNRQGQSVLLIKIQDVQDKPPYFTNLPYSVSILENATLSTRVLQVTALDGDKGVPNPVIYSFHSGEFSNFDIDENTGWITVSSTLDRDTPELAQKGGTYAITVKATERDNSSQPVAQITATTLVTIKVDDVNDNGPVFNSHTYQATILENMQEGVPITFTVPIQMNVADLDQGVNSHFSLSLEKDGQPYTDFDTQPTEVFVESSILIRAQNSAALDHEQLPNITFQIVAREISTSEKRSSVADVTVQITDMNDNAPVFEPTVLPPITMREDAATGTTLIILNATDSDRGMNGQIVYHIRESNSVFQINQATGEITLLEELDRETRDNYIITAEARDGGGLTTFINLDVKVLDVNDNKPMFRRDEYYVTVKEDSLEFLRGDLVVEATDFDESGSDNSHVEYRKVTASAGLVDSFNVNRTSGKITLVKTIDYESLPASLDGRVLLEVEAYDLGTPSFTNRINITVEIEDVNDNSPQFNQTTYTSSILESAAAGSSVLQVFASDDDATRPSNSILYRIDNGASDKFRIDFTTGVISVEVGARLDRETKDTYTLNVSATDRGAVPKIGLCMVVITVLDVNDEPPVFVPNTLEVSINENAATDDEVVCLVATDPDNNPNLVYSLLPESVKGFDEDGRSVNVTNNNIQDYFKMSGAGCVQVAGELDRETVEMVIVNTIVEDTNAVQGGHPQTATGTLTITLLDSNDNAPQFLPSNVYNIRIPEGLDLTSTVMRFEAEDKDKDQTITYSMNLDPYDNFQITPSTGVMRLFKKLDRETTPDIVVEVIAVDSGDPAITSTATVSITVQDINDNSPKFEPYNTVYTVPEDADIGTPIAFISATDDDLGVYGDIRYTFDVSNNDNKLTINATTGEISVAGALDREVRSAYTLYVTAIDNPSNPDNQMTTNSIIIQVSDINDNDPIFSKLDGSWPTVLENESPPKLIYTVTAEDKDENENSELLYSLSGTHNVLALFNITTVSRTIGGTPKYFGEIRVASSLIGKTGDQHFNISVTDKGAVPRAAETEFVITVEDVNTNKPVFVRPSGTNASISTLEKQSLNELIYTISASDADSGRNAEVTYTILKENDWQSFLLDPQTGVLTNKAVLDRETHPIYVLKIKAEDKGVPEALSTILTLTIVMLDENDNPPEFTGDRTRPYKIQVEEERVAEQSSTSLDIAVDKDAGNNSIICYYIVGGDPLVSSHFSLAQSGNLTMTKALDRETLAEPFINMLIMATPKCQEDIPNDSPPPYYPPDGYNTNRSLLWVQVEIQDINDNPPQFKQSVLTLGVTRDTGFGTSITNLQDLVTDPDETMKVEFSALNTEQHIQPTVSTSQPFTVFKNGTVATNVYFKANMYGYFLIHIQAKENVTGGQPFIANATLRISLINDDQRLKVVFRNSPDVVRGFQVVFTQKLQNTTGYRIVVDKIQTHESKDGSGVNANMTDMYIHGEDLKTNETVSAQELLRVIDSYAVALLGLRYDYKVVEIVPTTEASKEKSLEETYKMALIIVSIVLALLCIAIIIYFYVTIQQYKRKLKAATALAYGSHSDLHKMELPGTNVHAYENANPIYLEKVQLEVAGEQDDDVSLDNNAVENPAYSRIGEQHMTMNFYTEDKSLNKLPQSKLGTGDAILNAALLQHQHAKLKNGTAMPSMSTMEYSNGHVDNKDSYEGFPATPI